MSLAQLEIAMLIQSGAFVLLAAALTGLALCVVRLIETLAGLRRQIAELTGNPLHKTRWPAPGQIWPPRKGTLRDVPPTRPPMMPAG